MRKYKFMFYLLVLLIISIVLITLNNSVFDCGTSFFFRLENGNQSAFSILYLFIFTLAILDDEHQNMISGFDHLRILRIGYHKHIRQRIIHVFLSGAMFNLIANICILLYIHQFKQAITFQEEYPIFLAFTQDQGMNLLAFLICSFLGNGLLAIFGYAIAGYFQNIYTYRFSLVILMLAGVIIFAVLPLPNQILQYHQDIKVLTISFLPVGLFSPGMFFEQLGYLNFISTALCYTAFSTVLFFFMRKRQRYYG